MEKVKLESWCKELSAFAAGCLMFACVSVTHGQPEDGRIRLADDVLVRKLAEGIWLTHDIF